MINVFTDTFQVLVSFENLDLLDNQPIAKKALYGLSGIYACVHIETGTSYIGSSVNLADRIMDHIHNNSYNLHLQNAIDKYGLSHFAFVILEYCLSSDIIKREQLYLDILFSLPAYLRYNFAKFAEAPFTGLTHTPESKAQMSDSKSGANNHMYGKTHTPETRAKMSDAKSGANNPMFGKFGITPTNAMTINVYSLALIIY